MRMARVRKYDEEMHAVPDHFMFRISGTEEKTSVEYEEEFLTSETRFNEIGKTQADRQKSRFPDDRFESSYANGIGTVRVSFTGERGVCLSRVLNEIAFQAKCFFNDEAVSELLEDTRVRDTWIWRED